MPTLIRFQLKIAVDKYLPPNIEYNKKPIMSIQMEGRVWADIYRK